MNKELRSEIKTILKEHVAEYKNDKYAVDLVSCIIQLSHIHYSHFNKAHEKYNIKYPGLPLMFHLLDLGGNTTQSNLAKIMPASRQVLTVTLNVLEKAGFVERSVHEEDHRKRRVQLTPKGIELLHEVMPTRKAYYKDFMKYVTKEEADEVVAILKKVNNYFEKDLKRMAREKKKQRKKYLIESRIEVGKS